MSIKFRQHENIRSAGPFDREGDIVREIPAQRPLSRIGFIRLGIRHEMQWLILIIVEPWRSILEAQRLEQQEIAGDKRATAKTEQESNKTHVPARVLESMPGTGVEPVRPLRGSGF
jgi:hypothetical protein